MLMASKPLLAKKSGIKGIFSFSFPRIVTGLNIMCWPISSISVLLYFVKTSPENHSCSQQQFVMHIHIMIDLRYTYRVVIDIGKGGNGARWYTTPRSHYKFNGIGKTVLSRYNKNKACGSMSFVQLLDQALYTNNPIPYLLSMTLYWKTMQTQVVPNQW